MTGETALPGQPAHPAASARGKRLLTKVDVVRRTALMLGILISGGNLIIPRVPVLLAMILLSVIAMAATKKPLARGRFTAIYGLMVIIFLAVLFRSGVTDLQSTVIRYANFAGGILLLQIYLRAGQDRFVDDLSKILSPLAFVSIATVFLSTFLNPLFQPIEVQETVYYHLFYIFNYHFTLENAGGLNRPNGPFFEPGVFQIYLNIYLYITLFVLRRFRAAAFAGVAVLATQSTTGIAIATGLIGLHVWRELGRGSIHQRAMVLAASVILAVSLSGYVVENVRSKFFGDAIGSSMARQFDLLTGVNVIMAHPVSGIGFDPDRYRQISAQYAFADTLLDDRMTEGRSNSNGVIVLLYSLGIPLSLPFLFGLLRQTMLPDTLLVGGLLLVSSFTEALLLTPFFLCFVFSGLLLKGRTARTSQAAPQSSQFNTHFTTKELQA